MLGDWVGYIGAYEDESGEIVKLWQRPISIKVTFITPDAVQYEDEEGCYECMDYELYPIPITPEILEKNGMKVFEHRNPWQEAKNLIKKWYSKDGRFYVSYYRVGDIKYIHQLQNALRFCGIEKEIVL